MPETTTRAKRGTAVQLTPDEAARAKAATLLQLELQKADIEQKAAELKAELTEYVKETGNTELGAYTVTIGEQKPKIDLDHLTGNAKSRIIEQLMAELPDYQKAPKAELDWEKIYYALPTSPAVANALKVRNLEFNLVQSYTFRKAK